MGRSLVTVEKWGQGHWWGHGAELDRGERRVWNHLRQKETGRCSGRPSVGYRAVPAAQDRKSIVRRRDGIVQKL